MNYYPLFEILSFYTDKTPVVASNSSDVIVRQWQEK